MGVAIFTCDGCGKQEHGSFNGQSWFKPSQWYARTVYETTENGHERPREVVACSRACIKLADTAEGSSKLIIPL